MYRNFKLKIKNLEILGLIILILVTVILISFFNYNKNKNYDAYNDFTNNIYLQKTLKHIIGNLEPKYKIIKHEIISGETFDKILENYSIEKKEIIKIKNALKKKININKLNTKQNIKFKLDKTNNKN